MYTHFFFITHYTFECYKNHTSVLVALFCFPSPKALLTFITSQSLLPLILSKGTCQILRLKNVFKQSTFILLFLPILCLVDLEIALSSPETFPKLSSFLCSDSQGQEISSFTISSRSSTTQPEHCTSIDFPYQYSLVLILFNPYKTFY